LAAWAGGVTMTWNTRLKTGLKRSDSEGFGPHRVGLGSPDDALSRMLRALPKRNPPADLAIALRVHASRERQRLLVLSSPRGAFADWCGRLRLLARNVMGPVALPAAGGVFSAIVLLGMWIVPTYPARVNSAFDVPTELTTEVGVRSAGEAHRLAQGIAQAVAVAGDDVVVDVRIDALGRMVDYRIVSGPGAVLAPGFRRSLENLLLLTEFVPATAFGKPGLSTLRLTLSPSSVEVRG